MAFLSTIRTTTTTTTNNNNNQQQQQKDRPATLFSILNNEVLS
jgi:hypothetical protein